MILCLVKYSEIVDTISLVQWKTQFIVLPRFILNNIERVLNMYTLLFFSEKKTKIKTHYFFKNLYISYTAMYQDHWNLETLKLHYYM